MNTHADIQFPPTPTAASRDTRVLHRQAVPEFVTLPARGGDPVCGLSRSWWYAAEQRGLIRLIRLRKPGRLRGRVLLPVVTAVALVRKLDGESAAIA